VRPCAPSSDVWPHPRAGPAWHQVFRVFAAACHRAPDHAYPAARAHPRSPVISTRRRPRGGSSLRTRAPGVGKGHGRSLLPTRISRHLAAPAISHLSRVGRGPKSKLFREAISSPALQHILMYHKRAYALVRDLRPTDSPEGHTYYTNPGRGRLLCHRLRRTTAYLDDLPIELESQSRPS